jgi:hypothetical protein
MRTIIALAAVMLALSGCVAPSGGGKKHVRVKTVQPADQVTRQCLADLGQLRARYSLLPEQDFGNGCAIKGAVQLAGTDIPIANIKAIRCPMARNLALWLRDDVQTAARTHLGARVVRLDSMGAYACRTIIGGNSNKLSEHATGNAVDIGGFRLSDGRVIAVKAGWHGGNDGERRFLRAVRASACKRFQTVLSPDYNAAHHDHLHFDMGRGPFCR